MSDPYTIDGVTVTPLGGGHYELTHSELGEPERVRGKEEADKRAAELGKALLPADGSMEPQGDIPATVSADDQAAQIAALQAQLRESEAAREELAASVRTVVQNPDAERVTSQIPADAPRAFTGTLDKGQKKALKDAGLETARIVLEENEDIPPTGLFIGHNGRGYMIAPGEEVDVPEFLLSVLDDAVTASPVFDSKTRKVLGYRSRMKYPYRRVR